MSLRIFHVLFISASILLAAVAGGWGVQQFLETGSGVGLATGIAFFVAGVGMVVYGVRYFHKLKELER